MPRGKKPPSRSSRLANNPSRGGGRNAFEARSKTSSGTSTPTRGGYHGLTLQEEARNTERHHSFWNTDSRLRHSNVNFVRGGSLDPTLEKQPEVENATSSMADMAIEPIEENAVVEVFEDADIEADNSSPLQDLFFIDTQAVPVQTGLPPPRVASPTPSDSGSEIILFGGRDAHGRPITRSRKAARLITDPIEQRIELVEKAIHDKEELLERVLHHQSQPEPLDNITVESRIELEVGLEIEVEEEIEVTSQQRRTRPRRRGRGRGQDTEERYEAIEEDALIADYIANMSEDAAAIHNSFGHRDLGGTDEDLWLDETGQSSSEALHVDASGWDRDNMDDFNDFSTSDGVMGDVAEILNKRTRTSGVQYLVRWDQQSVSEARWVPSTTLISTDAQRHVKYFEREAKLAAEFEEASESEEDTDVSSEADLSIKAPSPREPANMSDAQMARLLAKQQDLGIDAEELVLFDGNGVVSEDEDLIFAQSFIATPARAQNGREKAKFTAKGLRRSKGGFPVASAYDDFDVMDFERPSVQRKSKGKKGKLVLDLSDSELEESMNNAWENDRVKKKERKQEREELRAQGLLGNKNGKPNMRDKYKEGIAIGDIREEIKNFLQSDHTTLALPPMEKEQRKTVHQFAQAFRLKSKSDGAGKKRFPILYKTQRTQTFSEHTFDALASSMSRRFLKRPDISHRKAGGGRDRGGNMGAVSYRDGDVVGASAPELGAENRGRAMLEKMGWSSGTALGAMNNKGILQPVSHVVKNTKAGLG